jgi:hypothetical protein
VRDLLSDANPTVVANAVAALNEIQDASGKDVFEVTSAVLQKLLAALNECTEWGQVFILDSLAKYVPSDPREAENIIERVSPRLNHQNPAVVLSAVKIILMYLEPIQSADTVGNICKKLAPPLISLAQAAQPEVQYVALRNVNIIVQKRPHLLSHKIKVFFCKYNDPIYVKMEKLAESFSPSDLRLPPVIAGGREDVLELVEMLIEHYQFPAILGGTLALAVKITAQAAPLGDERIKQALNDWFCLIEEDENLGDNDLAPKLVFNECRKTLF